MFVLQLGGLGVMFVVLVVGALLGGGLLVNVISGRSMYLVIYRLDHPEGPLPSWFRHSHGLSDLIEHLRIHYRYFRLYGLDASVFGYLAGFACMVAGVVVAEYIDEIVALLGWN